MLLYQTCLQNQATDETDYTRQFDWIYDLKRDVYNCYIKARENKSVGYMKRSKSYWDELHPGLSFLSDKNLRDVASRIAANKVVMDTEFHNTISIEQKIT